MAKNRKRFRRSIGYGHRADLYWKKINKTSSSQEYSWKRLFRFLRRLIQYSDYSKEEIREILIGFEGLNLPKRARILDKCCKSCNAEEIRIELKKAKEESWNEILKAETYFSKKK